MIATTSFMVWPIPRASPRGSPVAVRQFGIFLGKWHKKVAD
jgi:hypothetical protein